MVLLPLRLVQAEPDIFGSNGNGKSLTEQVAGGSGYNTAVSETTLAEVVGKIIGIVLVIIGLLFFVLLFYAGYLWFIARGDEAQVEKAVSIIKMAVIGLVITLSAYAVSIFVVRAIGGATGGNNRVGTNTPGQQQQNNQPPVTDSCKNGKEDGFETDIDCGGRSCAACKQGKKCGSGNDCESGNCSSDLHICQAETNPDLCSDGKLDNGESDVDCGGLTCSTKCSSGQKCTANYDCDSNNCLGTAGCQ
jgi:hypothetical protein